MVEDEKLSGGSEWKNGRMVCNKTQEMKGERVKPLQHSLLHIHLLVLH